MADFRARQRVQLHDGTDEFAVTAAKPIFVNISDGTDTALVDAAGNLQVVSLAQPGVDIGDVTVNNAAGASAVNIQDGGNSITIDDGSGSITVDGTVSVSGSVTVTATDLDIRNLDNAQDDVLIYANTAKDGTGTSYVPVVDSDGQLQVDVLSLPAITIDNTFADDSAFTVGTSKVGAIGALADETTPDSVDEGDIGIPRMTLDRKLLTRIVGASDANRLDVDASGHAQIDIAAISLTALPVSRNSSANSETNPLFVQVVSGAISGTEIHNYDTSAAVAKDASDNHDYTVTGAKTLLLKSVIVAASGAMKVTVQVGPVASLVTKAVLFTSGAKPTEQLVFDPPIEVPDTSTGTVRLIRRNDDNQAMDVYSTIVGTEV